MNILWMQCKMESIRILRNRYFLIFSILMPITFYFIFTRIVNTGIPNPEEWQARYLMSMAAFSVMGSALMSLSIRNVEERSKGWSLLFKVTPLPDSVYFLAKMVGQSVVHLLSIMAVFIVGALINGVQLPLTTWLLSGMWLLVASFAFMALGTLIGLMKKVDTAMGVSNVLYLVLAVIGGLWMPLDVFPELLQAIGKWLPSYSFANGAWQLVVGEVPEWRNGFILIGYALIFMVLSVYIRRKQEAV